MSLLSWTFGDDLIAAKTAIPFAYNAAEVVNLVFDSK